MKSKLFIIFGALLVIVAVVLIVVLTNKSEKESETIEKNTSGTTKLGHEYVKNPAEEIKKAYQKEPAANLPNVRVFGNMTKNGSVVDGIIYFNEIEGKVEGGTFEFKNLPSGTYQVVFTDTKGFPYELDQPIVQVLGDSFFDFKIKG